VTEPRTIVLATADHGPVTLPEPTWCRGHDDHRPDVYRCDLTHYGTETVLAFEGAEVFRVMVSESPYATRPEDRAVCGYVEECGYTGALDAVQLYGLAAALDTYADHLRDLADQVDTLNGGEN
jgi:hypothetical protein